MHRKMKNEGMTLVEVIISLLIIMIIFVPLLSTFLSATSIGIMTKQKIYASNLADNVMETVKVLGINGVALQFYENPDQFILADGTALSYLEELYEGVTSSVKLDAMGNKVFDSSRNTKPYQYKITGVQEGTGTFDVLIRFESASYTTDTSLTPTPTPIGAPATTPAPLPNDFAYADLSAFNASTTALINPKISGIDYDYLVKAYFKQLNENYYYNEWVDACEAVNTANDVIYRAYEQACDAALNAGRPTPTVPPVTPLPTQKPALSEDALNNRITKTTNIEISKTIEGAASLYNLNSFVTYNFNNILNNGSNVEGICSDPTNAVLTRNYAGYCDNVKTNALETLFLMYTPFTGVSDLSRERIRLNNSVVESFDVYFVIQAAQNAVFSSPLKVELSGSASILNLYSQARLEVIGSGNAITSNGLAAGERLIQSSSLDQARIYRVTIDILESGTGNKLQTLNSTVLSE